MTSIKNNLIINVMLSFLAVFIMINYNLKANTPGRPDIDDKNYIPVAEVMPAPIGGMDAIQKNVVYPPTAKSNGIKGNVLALVYINESGIVDDVKIIKGIGGGCDEAVITALQECKFTPGMNKGVSVKMKLAVRIKF